jgi:preprotein translocase subunit YajC
LTVPSTAFLTLAQATQQSSTQAAASPSTQPRPAPFDLLGNPMFPLLLGIIVLYFFMYRSKRNQDKEKKAQLEQMKRGDRVMTAGGIIGKIVEVEDSKILVKVDENSNTKIWFTRDAIRRVLTDDKVEAK